MRNTTVFAKFSLFVAIGVTPTLLLAQHGMVRGMGGGFHGGGGVGHFYGSHYGAGYYGGHGIYAWHAGYHGPWYRTGWGYPYYGIGFGVSIGFGWAPYPYWVPYPYAYGYGYGPWLVPRYYSPSNDECDYRHQSPTIGGQDCQSSSYVPRTMDSVSPNATRSPDRNPSRDPGTEPPDTYTLDQSNQVKLISNKSTLRRELKNALATLRAMPPAARQRWLNSGHYEHFSPEERALLKQVSDNQPLSNPIHVALANAH